MRVLVKNISGREIKKGSFVTSDDVEIIKKQIPVFVNGVCLEVIEDVGAEERHIFFTDIGKVVCKRHCFILDGHQFSIFAGVH